MPAGPGEGFEEHPSYNSYNSFGQSNRSIDVTNNNKEINGDESAASILQSVKEQEAQFEALTKELEVERQSVANQLERCKLGSETASMSSISSTDESFHWRPPPHDSRFEEESDADSKVSGSQLVDSCLRVLQERGLMNVGEDAREHLPEDPRAQQTQQNTRSQQVTVTKVVTTREVKHGSHGSLQQDNSVTYNNLIGPPGRGPPSLSGPSPAGTPRDGPPSSEPSYAGRPNGPTDPSYTHSPQFGGGKPEDPYSQIPGRYNPGASPHGPRFPDARDSPYNSVQDEPPYGARTPTRPDDPYARLPNQPPYNGSHPSLSGPGDRGQPDYPDGYRPDTSYQDEPGYTHPAGHFFPSPDAHLPNHRDNQPPESPYQAPDEDPYGSRHPVNQDPYGSRQHVPESPQTNRGPPAEDPYGSHQRLPEDPYGRQLQPEEAPYVQSPPQAEDPYSRGPPRDEDPYGRAQPRAEDPYGRAPPRDEDPYGRGPPRDEDPYSRGAPHTEDPYGRGPPRDEDPFNRSQLPDEDPYGRGQPRDEFGSNRPLMPSDRDRFMRPEDPERLGVPPGDQRSQRTASPAPSFDRHGSQPVYGSQSRLPFDPESSRGPMDDTEGYEPRAESNLMLGAPGNGFDPDRSLPPDSFDPDGRRPFDPDGPPSFGGPDGMPDDMERRSPSIDSQNRDQVWRNPDLHEVIEYLSHPNDSIKANAAAYLQHLCYMDDQTKAKTRSLGGIPHLVELVANKFPEVHRAACGALRNLSYGRANDENKLEIQKASGIPELVRLLRKSPDNDVRELVTGILWNLSSLQPLKQPIIDDGLAPIVGTVIVPHSGWDKNGESHIPRDVYWSTVFRNASGVLRNVSSDGPYARKKLRECEGLVESILHIVKAAIGKNDIDNKPVENCVCILRNLSYACQEVHDPDYLKKRSAAQADKGESTSCFGGSSKKKKDTNKNKSQQNLAYQNDRPPDYSQGMSMLWHPSVVNVYLPLLSDCTNPETLEAAAGAIQNLAACEWQPSVEIRSSVRKEKGLPIIVDLLTLDADRVICAAASALRNLVLDQSSKELIGKYAMHQLVTKLPSDKQEPVATMETICAVECLLYEVIKNSNDFAKSLMDEGGVEKLIYITKCQKFSPKVVKFASSLLNKMWSYKELHLAYKNRNLKESDFLYKPKTSNKSPPDSTHSINSAENTLHRPGMSQGGPTMAGVNENTLPGITRQGPPPAMANNVHGGPHNGPPHGGPPHGGPAHGGPPHGAPPHGGPQSYPDGDMPPTPTRDPYGQPPPMDRYGQDIPMTQLGAPPQGSPGFYDTIESRRGDQHPPDYERHQSYDRAPNDGGRPQNYSFDQNSFDQRPHDTSYDRRPHDMSYDSRQPHDVSYDRHNNHRPPPGGVPLFPNLPPGSLTPVPQDESREPLYAKVNKQSVRRPEPGHVNIGPDTRMHDNGGPGGADSWV